MSKNEIQRIKEVLLEENRLLDGWKAVPTKNEKELIEKKAKTGNSFYGGMKNKMEKYGTISINMFAYAFKEYRAQKLQKIRRNSGINRSYERDEKISLTLTITNKGEKQIYQRYFNEGFHTGSYWWYNAIDTNGQKWYFKGTTNAFDKREFPLKDGKTYKIDGKVSFTKSGCNGLYFIKKIEEVSSND